MNAATDRLEFAPPPTPGMLRALGLAVLAHAILLAALTWGVHWKSEPEIVTAEAELWSTLPQQAAPRAVEVPPEPPAPDPPAPPKPPRPAPVQAPPKMPDADIAVVQEKLRLKREKQAQLDQERARERERELKDQRQEKLKQEKLRLEQKQLQAKREQERQAAEDKQKLTQEAQRKDALKTQKEAKALDAMRQENMKRMAGLAGATGSPGASGTDRQSSGPSSGYGGRIRASIKPNIVFIDQIAGNPTAEVEVRTSPDGTILSRKLTKSSGVESWDEAVLKAIDKTAKLPSDVDGRVPTTLVISFRPRD